MEIFSNFFLYTKLEITKLTKHKLFWIYIYIMIVIIGLITFYPMRFIDEKSIKQMPNGNIWYLLIRFKYFQIAILGLIYGFIANIHFQNDYKNDMIKHYAFLPIKPFLFFLSKLSALLICILMVQIIFFFVFSVSIYLNGIKNFTALNHSYSGFFETLPFQILLCSREYLSFIGYLSILSLFNYYVQKSIFSIVFVILLWRCNFSTLSRFIPSGFAVQSDKIMLKFSKDYNFSIYSFYYEFMSIVTLLLVLVVMYFLIKMGKLNYSSKII